jgi:hypothetical protein
VYSRTERVLTFIAFFAAVAIVVVGVLRIEKRRNETHAAAPRATAGVTATPLASPPPTSRSGASVTTPEPATPTPSLPPPPTPTAPPVVAATPFVRPPGASPMPHTGGGAVPQGLALTFGAALAAIVARHTEARSSARSSTG